eukprot:gene19277-biopygen43493
MRRAIDVAVRPSDWLPVPPSRIPHSECDIVGWSDAAGGAEGGWAVVGAVRRGHSSTRRGNDLLRELDSLVSLERVCVRFVPTSEQRADFLTRISMPPNNRLAAVEFEAANVRRPSCERSQPSCERSQPSCERSQPSCERSQPSCEGSQAPCE